MAELRQLGAIDPEAQEKLMADLLQSDRGMWPMLLTQVRAAAAYRQQAQRRDGGADVPPGPVTVAQAAPVQTAPIQAAPIQETPPQAARMAALQEQRPPLVFDRAVVADARPVQQSPTPASDHSSAKADASVASAGEQLPAKENLDSGVKQASYNAVTPSDWQAHLAAAIRELEVKSSSQSPNGPKTEAEIAQQARLRMLYLLAGRREDAMRPIPSAPNAAQEFWSQQLFGMATWLDTERTPDGPRRAAEAKRILNDALVRLGETAPLMVRNLAFCTAVQSYGAMTPFKKCEFVPDQELLLYAEVENFATEPTPKGHHTSLRSSYQIFDSRGQRVADQEFPPIEETCQNPRRDFFIGYHLRVPKRIYPGKHKLQLTIEDAKSRKVGQSSIEFTVKGEG